MAVLVTKEDLSFSRKLLRNLSSLTPSQQVNVMHLFLTTLAHSISPEYSDNLEENAKHFGFLTQDDRKIMLDFFFDVLFLTPRSFDEENQTHSVRFVKVLLSYAKVASALFAVWLSQTHCRFCFLTSVLIEQPTVIGPNYRSGKQFLAEVFGNVLQKCPLFAIQSQATLSAISL